MHFQKLLHQYPLPKTLLLLFMFVLMGVGAIPSYITGKWPWIAPPPVPTLRQLRNLEQQGLTFEGWQTIREQPLTVGGHKWLLQQIQKDKQTRALVLMLAQRGPMDQPQVEWMDINGYWRWSVDQIKRAEFIVEILENVSDVVPGENTRQELSKKQVLNIQARFFRTWTGQETYAVLQWYAFPEGGHPAPSHWFWRDRAAQLSGKRVPWVAVSIVIPIEPFGDIEKYRPLAESLGKSVQGALIAGPLKSSP